MATEKTYLEEGRALRVVGVEADKARDDYLSTLAERGPCQAGATHAPTRRRAATSGDTGKGRRPLLS